MGDPAGIGPELCLRICSEYPQNNISYIIYGNRNVLSKVATATNLSMEDIDIVDIPIEKVEDITSGKVQPNCGQASYDFLTRAISDCLQNKVDAIVTCPLNKAALEAAGIKYPGHTEILIEQTKTEQHAMMLTSPEMSCSLVTTHIGIVDIPKALTTARIIQVAKLTRKVLEKRLKKEPTLAVLGLNPHAGEGGLFGEYEEENIIQPAITQLKSEGATILGPLSPDTAFLPNIRSKVDGYICMYHDQGLIPLKTLSFDEGVNVTLGLPIIRTSVDHGTAYDIAWTGKASVESLCHAVDYALSLIG